MIPFKLLFRNRFKKRYPTIYIRFSIYISVNERFGKDEKKVKSRRSSSRNSQIINYRRTTQGVASYILPKRNF